MRMRQTKRSKSVDKLGSEGRAVFAMEDNEHCPTGAYFRGVNLRPYIYTHQGDIDE